MLPLLLEAAIRSFFAGAAVWLGIYALRAYGTRGEALAWTCVLAASFAMPFLMRLTPVTLAVFPPWGFAIPASPFTDLVAAWLVINIIRARSHEETLAWSALLAASFAMQVVMVGGAVASPQREMASALSFLTYWPMLLTALYVSVASLMLLRLTVRLVVTWLVFRRAIPARAGWTGGHIVRVSGTIKMPGTFGSTILLPQDHAGWPPHQRNAVLAHEASHVSRGDFHLLTLAAIHRCVFWFSPLAWFIEARLALLAEMASDDDAIRAAGGAPAYADVLLAFAGREPAAMAAVAMARQTNLVERIDRILVQDATPPALTRCGRLIVFAYLVPLIATAAGLSLAVQTSSLREVKMSVASSSHAAAAPGQTQKAEGR